MKGTDEHFTARGLGKVVLLALLVDLVIYPFSQSARAPAQQALPASLLNTAVTLLLTLPLLKLAQQVKEPGQATGTKVLWGAAALLFACGGGEGIVRAEGFVRYVSDEPLPHLVVYVLLLLCAVWAVVVITSDGMPYFNTVTLQGSMFYQFFSRYNPFV